MHTLEIDWSGPYAWPGFELENNLPSLPRVSGVYLFTFAYHDGYAIYAAGITRRTMPQRFREHTRKYRDGNYNVLDPEAASQGERREIWHGWDYAREHRDEFNQRRREILAAVDQQLASMRIFVAALDPAPRILDRIEAAVMNALYRQPEPLCNLPDRGMFLAPRWPMEAPITACNHCERVLCGLPEHLLI